LSRSWISAAPGGAASPGYAGLCLGGSPGARQATAFEAPLLITAVHLAEHWD